MRPPCRPGPRPCLRPGARRVATAMAVCLSVRPTRPVRLSGRPRPSGDVFAGGRGRRGDGARPPLSVLTARCRCRRRHFPLCVRAVPVHEVSALSRRRRLQRGFHPGRRKRPAETKGVCSPKWVLRRASSGPKSMCDARPHAPTPRAFVLVVRFPVFMSPGRRHKQRAGAQHCLARKVF